MTAELKAGLFVLAALGSLFYMTTKLTQNRFSFAGTKKYYAQITDASGLLSKTKVKMAGLDVGQLITIDLVGKHARITMEIAGDMVLHRDASVSVKSIGFLGDKYIELHEGSDAEPPLPEGSTLAESLASGSFEQLTQKTSEVLDNIKEITSYLKDALKGAGGEGDETRLDRILDNMETFSEGLASLDRIGDLADRLTETASNVRDITDKVKRGEGTIGKLLNDEQTVDKLNATLSGVNKLVTKADRLSVIVDAHSGWLSNYGSSTSTVSLILQPTFDKYYLFGVTSSPHGVQNQTTTTTTVNGGTATASSSVVNQSTTDTTSIGFNAQFAKRFGDLTAKVGLFESTGGAGLDYQFMEDKLKIFTEIYRFSKGENPQLNVGTEFHVFKPFYLWVGGEDIVNPMYRSFFLGAGIRFNDQDIKSLVGVAALGSAVR